MPGGANGIGGRANDGGPTAKQTCQYTIDTDMHYTEGVLGGIIPIPRPAGMPRPGPIGS